MTQDNPLSLQQTIQKEAAQCVKCGLCLPHCPTYMLTENECESPRGRIALMDGFARNELPLSKKANLYLDHCLTCRACEAVCPADVAYGSLIDHMRTLQNKLHMSTTKLPRSLELLLLHPRLLRFTAQLLRLYQRLALQWLARKTGLLSALGLKRADAFLPTLNKPIHFRGYYPAQHQEQGRVALFMGCITQLVDQTTLMATIKVLTACGYGVYVPPTQACCGALHQHAGFAETVVKLCQTNIKAFRQQDISAIITVASGCAAELQDYSQIAKESTADAFTAKIIDISQFLLQIKWPAHIKLRPLSARVALHTPCTLRNVLKEAAAPAELLRKIPAIELLPLTSTSTAHCCGAAGLYMLQHPTMADDLLKSTLSQLDQLNPAWIATSNIGCNLNIAKAVREKNPNIHVVHPIMLLAQQLEF